MKKIPTAVCFNDTTGRISEDKVPGPPEWCYFCGKTHPCGLVETEAAKERERKWVEKYQEEYKKFKEREQTEKYQEEQRKFKEREENERKKRLEEKRKEKEELNKIMEEARIRDERRKAETEEEKRKRFFAEGARPKIPPPPRR